MLDMDIDFLRRALEIEERAFTNAKAAYEQHKNGENEKLAIALKEIMDDEENHVTLIREMMEKKKKRISAKN